MPEKKSSSRSAKGRGSVQQRTIKNKNGKEYTYYTARVTVGHDPISGKQVQRTFTGKTQQEVVKKMIDAQNSVNQGEYVNPSKYTLAQYLRQWLEGKKDSVSINTYSTYKQRIDNHIIRIFGEKIKLSDISKIQVQKFVERLKKEGYSSKTIRSTHGVLCKALMDAERLEIIKRNPAEKCELPKVTHKEVKPFSDQEIASLLSLCSLYKNGDILLFIVLSGLRESECLGLCFDCVDFKNNCITIKRQLQKHGNDQIRIENTKNGKARKIVLAKSAMNILRARQSKQIRDRFKVGDQWQGWQNDTERAASYVFLADFGKPVTRDSLYMTAKRIGKKLGRPELTVHDLRHAYATICLQNGTDLKTVSESLGHSTIAITADIYAGVAEKMKRENADRLEKFITSFTNVS